MSNLLSHKFHFQTLSQSLILSSKARVTSLKSKKVVRVLFCSWPIILPVMHRSTTTKSLCLLFLGPLPYCRPSRCGSSSLGLHGLGRQCACVSSAPRLCSLCQGEHIARHSPQVTGWKGFCSKKNSSAAYKNLFWGMLFICQYCEKSITRS